MTPTYSLLPIFVFVIVTKIGTKILNDMKNAFIWSFTCFTINPAVHLAATSLDAAGILIQSPVHTSTFVYFPPFFKSE